MQQQQQNATVMHDFELNRQTKSHKKLQNPHQITLLPQESMQLLENA